MNYSQKVYDPTNLVNEFLSESEIDNAIGLVNDFFKVDNDKKNETLKILKYIENKRRHFIQNKSDLGILKNEIREINLKFADKYEDWFHKSNKYYDKFYEIININRSKK